MCVYVNKTNKRKEKQLRVELNKRQKKKQKNEHSVDVLDQTMVKWF